DLHGGEVVGRAVVGVAEGEISGLQRVRGVLVGRDRLVSTIGRIIDGVDRDRDVLLGGVQLGVAERRRGAAVVGIAAVGDLELEVVGAVVVSVGGVGDALRAAAERGAGGERVGAVLERAVRGRVGDREGQCGGRGL